MSDSSVAQRVRIMLKSLISRLGVGDEITLKNITRWQREYSQKHTRTSPYELIKREYLYKIFRYC